MRQLTDSTGAVTFARTYDPYGVVTTATGSSASGYGFTGEWTDPGGLVYLRARHYAPGMGRFLTRDTWPGESNRPLSLNRWGYVEGNPINSVDPTGMSPECIAVAGSADYIKCERIIRGFDPRIGPSPSELRMYDLDPECFNYQLFSLPQFRPAWMTLGGPSKYDYEAYGLWFHYLLNEKSIREKGYRVSIGMALAIVASNEANVESLYPLVSQPIANAMILKGRARGMYLAMGSRQATIKNVESGIIFMGHIALPQRNSEFCETGAGVGNCYDNFEKMIDAYNPLTLEYQDMPGKIASAFAAYPSKPSEPNDVPDEWGNATKDTEDMKIWDILNTELNPNVPQYNSSPDAVYWRSGRVNGVARGQFFIVTPNQASLLCKGFSSCIKK